MELADSLSKLNQFDAFGLPPGPSVPNPDRASGLDALATRRNERGVAKLKDDEGRAFGYAALAIPELDYYVLLARFPDLNSKDRDTQKRAWQQFCKSEHSLPYRVDASIGKRQRDDGIIVR